jgi:hypothetical protein
MPSCSRSSPAARTTASARSTSSSSRAAGSTCTSEPDETSHRGGSRLGPDHDQAAALRRLRAAFGSSRSWRSSTTRPTRTRTTIKPSRTRTGHWPAGSVGRAHASPHGGDRELSLEVAATSQHRLPGRKRPALAMSRQQAPLMALAHLHESWDKRSRPGCSPAPRPNQRTSPDPTGRPQPSSRRPAGAPPDRHACFSSRRSQRNVDRRSTGAPASVHTLPGRRPQRGNQPDSG